MSLNILVVEGNNPEDSSVFIKAAKASCSQNLKKFSSKNRAICWC
jgi:GMP synthase (glutamine-hydrolysing)